MVGIKFRDVVKGPTRRFVGTNAQGEEVYRDEAGFRVSADMWVPTGYWIEITQLRLSDDGDDVVEDESVKVRANDAETLAEALQEAAEAIWEQEDKREKRRKT